MKKLLYSKIINKETFTSDTVSIQGLPLIETVILFWFYYQKDGYNIIMESVDFNVSFIIQAKISVHEK